MKIKSLSRLLYLPLGIFFLAVWFYGGHLYRDYLILPVLGSVIVYLFSGQIDHWWLVKFPAGMDSKAIQWLEKYSPFYNSLSEKEKQHYLNRLGVYINAREFKQMQGKEKINTIQDFKLLIAHQAINLTFAKEDYLIGDFDYIYTYGHPFPSPEIKQLHTVETEKEDGVILFDLSHGIAGVVNPAQHYNIIMHGYVEAYLHLYPEKLPDVTTTHLQKLNEVSGYSVQQIVKVIGHQMFEPDVLMITMFFTYPERFAKIYPELNKSYMYIFKNVGLT